MSDREGEGREDRLHTPTGASCLVSKAIPRSFGSNPRSFGSTA